MAELMSDKWAEMVGLDGLRGYEVEMLCWISLGGGDGCAGLS